MIKQEIRKNKVQKRHQSIRVKISGTSEAPRLAVYRSTKHIYAQIIDDTKHVTLVSASSLDKDLKENLCKATKCKAWSLCCVMQRWQDGIQQVTFHRVSV